MKEIRKCYSIPDFIERNIGTCPECGGEIMGSRRSGEKEIIPLPCGSCSLNAAEKTYQSNLVRHTEERSWLMEMDAKYRHVSWDDYRTKNQDQRRVLEKVQSWANGFSLGNWLVMYGRQGTGKTLLKNMLIRQLGTNGYKIHSTTMRDMYNRYLSNEGESRSAIEDQYARYDILFIDEVGRVTLTDPVKQFCFAVLDKIYLSRRSIVLISNMMISSKSGDAERKGISDYFDYDRLVEQATWIQFRHDSERKRSAA